MQNSDIAELKAGLDLRLLVGETHPINRAGKIACPFHDDAHPSCHIYPNGYKCFGCGSYGDHLSWLERVRGMSFSEALTYLGSRSGTRLPFEHTMKVRGAKPFFPISSAQLRAYQSLLARTTRLAAALERRGFGLADSKRLGIAADGKDAILPIKGPDQEILALKRRIYKAQPGARYHYVTRGHGSPSWCSPNVETCSTLLVIEGELNGMVAFLALQTMQADVAVMATAGTSGHLHDEILLKKRVYIYADGDKAGRQAASRWRKLARRAGATSARRLQPLAQDACEIAGSCGQLYLASLYLEAMFGRRTSVKKQQEGLGYAA